MKRIRVVALAALVGVMACEGFRDAMTAHVDVAARAGSQQLSVQHLSELIGRAPVPLTKQLAQAIADAWTNYQLLALAAAHNDSLKDTTLIDQVMRPVFTNSRLNKWFAVVSQTWPVDTTNLEQKFNTGTLVSASHILFQVPQGQTATGSDSIRKKAEAVLKQTNAANFAAMAKKYGSDATKDRGGNLGIWRAGRGQMVPEFEKAVLALKPGEIGPLTQTQFGYHIIRRNTYAESKDAFRSAFDSLQKTQAESAYTTNVERGSKLEIKPNAAKVVKDIAANPTSHEGDKTVIATSTLGNYTAGEAAAWIAGSVPPNPPPETIRGQIMSMPDSVLPNLVKYLVREQLFLHQADSAKVKLEPAEIASIRQAFRMLVTNSWAGLHISPDMLVDSAKTPPEKEKLAAARVNTYLDRLLQNQETYVDVPAPLANALRQKYDGKVSSAGLDRALEGAKKIRALTDSSKAAQQPKSAVPMPTTPRDTGKPPAGKKGN